MAYRAKLRKVGGSVMLAIPPAMLNALDFESGTPVKVAVESGKLIVESAKRRRYSLSELLAQCDPKAKRPADNKTWVSEKPVGRELL